MILDPTCPVTGQSAGNPYATSAQKPPKLSMSTGRLEVLDSVDIMIISKVTTSDMTQKICFIPATTRGLILAEVQGNKVKFHHMD